MTASLAATLVSPPPNGVGPSRRLASMWRQPRVSVGALAGVVLAHAGLLGLLLAVTDSVEPVMPPRPLMMSLIEPEPVLEPDTPEPAPPADPTPAAPKPAAKPAATPVMAAKPVPEPVPEPEPEPEPEPVRVPEPEPMPEPEPEPVPRPEPVRKPTPVPDPAPKPTPVPEPAAAPKAAQPVPTPPRAAAYLNNPRPPYPALSKRLGEEGTVRLNILVNPDGSVARLELARSSGHPRLDRAAMDAVQSSWKFEPARQGGRPVAAWVIVPIQFTLRS